LQADLEHHTVEAGLKSTAKNPVLAAVFLSLLAGVHPKELREVASRRTSLAKSFSLRRRSLE